MAVQLSELTSGFNSFALKLYQELPKKDKSFFSPLSLSMALAALLVGAKGKTARELAEALEVDLSKESIQEGISRLMSDMMCRRGDGHYRI